MTGPAKKPTVQVVLAVDTEGPAFDPPLGLYSTWEEIEAAVARLHDPSFRFAQRDSQGEGAIVSWFILDWTGFTSNPVRRDLGYHRVHDRYLELLRPAPRDKLFWHYHHPPLDGVANRWNTDWLSRPATQQAFEYETILHRKILERNWFPNAYRAGGTIQSDDSSRWLNEWIPFDYSNRAPFKIDGVADWSRAPTRWGAYHPSVEDYQSPGEMRRQVVRCLDADSRNYTISQAEVDRAFAEAQQQGDSILAVFIHDYRDMASPLLPFIEKVADAARRHPQVHWCYAAADDAVRQGQPPDRLELELTRVAGDLLLRASLPLLGACPWLCGSRPDGSVQRLEATPLEALRWRIDARHLEGFDRVGVAANSPLGSTAVVHLELA